MGSKKKALLVCGLSLFAATALAGCAGDEPTPSESVSGGETSASTPASSSEQEASSEKGIDMEKFPNYVEDIENLAYSFGEKEMMSPYFLGNVIYNETAMMTKHEDGSVSAVLRYKPKKILSVRDYTWKTEYPTGSYSLQDNKIVMAADGEIPYWTEEQLVGENIPGPYVKKNTMALTNTATDYYVWGGMGIYTESDFYYGRQVQVSYVYDVNDLPEGVNPECLIDSLPNLKAKLEAKGNVKLVTVGDSVGEGCSSSFKFNHEPYMHPWADQIVDVLTDKYGATVSNANQSVGGKTSAYTSEDDSKLADIAKENPDALFIHYGINDLGGSVTPNGFRENIERIILYVQSNLPSCDIVLLSPIMPNPGIYDSEKLGMYGEGLQDLADTYSNSTHGVAFVDMTKLSLDYMQNGKGYFDLTANGINHPNDYGHRLYTQALSAALVETSLWKK